MNIGIDIDGVLTNLEEETINYGTKMCIENNWEKNIVKQKGLIGHKSKKSNFGIHI